MNKKNILALLLALCMLLSMAACGTAGSASAEGSAPAEAGSAPAEAAGDGQTYKIGVAIYQFDDNFMTLYRNELERYFKEDLSKDGNTYEVTTVDGKNDMATQTDQIRNFITQGMDLIICNLVQTSSADTIIDQVVAAGIPLVLINREPLG